MPSANTGVTGKLGERGAQERFDSRRGDMALDIETYSVLAPRGTGSPDRRRTPPGRATMPLLCHTTALGVLGVTGERRGAAAELSERGGAKGTLPGTACSVPEKPSIHSKMKSQYEKAKRSVTYTPAAPVRAVVLLYMAGGWLGLWVDYCLLYTSPSPRD